MFIRCATSDIRQHLQEHLLALMRMSYSHDVSFLSVTDDDPAQCLPVLTDKATMFVRFKVSDRFHSVQISRVVETLEHLNDIFSLQNVN